MAAAAAARALGYTICYKKSRDYVITTRTYVLSLIDENRKKKTYFIFVDRATFQSKKASEEKQIRKANNELLS